MNKHWRWLLFALLCVAQWTVPLGMVQRAERTLSEGTAYRFRTAPVDPADPFRGRYVTLDFDAAQLQVPVSWEGERDARMYAPVKVGADGFATLEPPRAVRPAQGDWLAVRILWHNEQQLRVALPFDRYYLDEQLAPEAERLYRERNRIAGNTETDAAPLLPTYASVRIHNGNALIEELYIDNVPVRTMVKAALSSQP